MHVSSFRRGLRGSLLLSVAAAAALALPALFHGNLAVSGQTAGPVATRTAALVADPGNGGVAIAPAASSQEAAASLSAAAQPGSGSVAAALPSSPNQVLSPRAASATGQGNTGPARAPQDLNLTPAQGVSLIAGSSLIYVPPQSASCAAVAQLAYTSDQAEFTANCDSGAALKLSQPGLLCMQPSPQILASALGNLANLSVTASQPLESHVSPSGVLVCASVQGAGSYTLSVTGKNSARPALHTLPKGAKLRLPAVGLGGLLPSSESTEHCVPPLCR